MHNTFTEAEIKFLTTLKGIAAERPDYVYDQDESWEIDTSCTYLNWRDAPVINGEKIPDKPSCIIGHVLLLGGYRDVDSLIGWEGSDALPILSNIEGLSYEFCRDMSGVQAAQDSHKTWRSAYDCGLDMLFEHGYSDAYDYQI